MSHVSTWRESIWGTRNSKDTETWAGRKERAFWGLEMTSSVAWAGSGYTYVYMGSSSSGSSLEICALCWTHVMYTSVKGEEKGRKLSVEDRGGRVSQRERWSSKAGDHWSPGEIWTHDNTQVVTVQPVKHTQFRSLSPLSKEEYTPLPWTWRGSPPLFFRGEKATEPVWAPDFREASDLRDGLGWKL